MNVDADLRKIPAGIATKARDILARLDRGERIQALHGKALTRNRNIISVPVTKRYRIVCSRAMNGKVVPMRVVSHETYNRLLWS